MTGWWAALRVARREARRAKGRAALVIAMIFLPVLALSFAAVEYRTFQIPPEIEAAREMGTADGIADLQQHGRGPTDLLGALPPGSRVIEREQSPVQFQAGSGTARTNGVALDITDPMTRGLVTLLHGRAPVSDTEVTISAGVAKRLDTGIGRTIRTADGARTYTVTGIIEFPGSLLGYIVFRPGAMPGPDDSDFRSTSWLVDSPRPLGVADVLRLDGQTISLSPRAFILHPPTAAEQAQLPSHSSDWDSSTVAVLSLGGVVVGLGLLEVVLLAGPAFAVGARRRQRDLAIVAANGGTDAHLRRLVLADGVIYGLIAAGLGITLGVVTALAARHPIEVYLAQERSGPFRVFPLALVVVAVIAVLTGLAGALVPAVLAARQDVVRALTGRRGVVRSRRRWLVLGLGACAAGAGLAAYGAWHSTAEVIVAGLVLGEVGLVLCTPRLIGLISRLGRVLPPAPRIALRDTGRNRAAAAPAVAAVMAAVAGSVATAMYLGAIHQRDVARVQPSLPLGYASVALPAQGDQPPLDVAGVDRALRRNLPTRDVVPVARPACPPSLSTKDCQLRLAIPQPNRCPYLLLNRPLTTAEQRSANRDWRCDLVNQWGSGNQLASTLVDDGPAVAALTGASPDEVTAATRMLRAGGIVVTDRGLVSDGQAVLVTSIGAADNTAAPTETRLSVPALYLRTATVPAVPIVSTGALARTILVSRPVGLLARTSRMPTAAEETRLRAAAGSLSPRYLINVERGHHVDRDPTTLILAIAAAVVALGAAAIATGLAAADGRADLGTLAAIGAAPRMRRILSLSQSGVIAGLGSLLGGVAGLGAAWAVVVGRNAPWADHWPHDPPLPMVVPWFNLGIALLAVPAVAMLGAGLLTRSRLPIERRRAT